MAEAHGLVIAAESSADGVTRGLCGSVLSAMGDVSGDEFTVFVHTAGTRFERAAFLLTGDRHLAEDLVQITLAKVYASWRRIKGDPFPYAYRTLVNSYASHRRLRRNSERAVDWIADTPAVENDPASRLDVLTALDALTPTDRAIVVLRYVEDLAVSETAHYLDLSEDVVRTRASRALRRLRPILTDPETTPRGHRHD